MAGSAIATAQLSGRPPANERKLQRREDDDVTGDDADALAQPQVVVI